MKEITIVTAYFNVGRDKWKCFSRNDEQYLSYFSHWARLKNKLVIYTTPSLAEMVQQIRYNYGLEKQTTIITIPNVYSVQSDLYQVIQHVMQNTDSWLFHKKLDHPESWNYNYNYITNLKTFWVQDAVNKGITTDLVAWLDFGYDHGGEEFPYSEDFDFLWNYNFSSSIHIFLAKHIDEKPIFKIIQDMDTYIRGGLIIAPSQFWSPLWHDIHDSLLSLAECGMADDDQTLLLMAYRRHPENFQTHLTTYWGEPLHAYGGQKLRVHLKQKSALSTFHKKMKNWLHLKQQQLDIYQRKGNKIYQDFFKE